MTRAKSWNRALWGVVYAHPKCRRRAILIGSLWHDVARNVSYQGQPTRALVFQHRHQARAWAAAYNGTNIGGRARMRVVRVRETVTVVA